MTRLDKPVRRMVQLSDGRELVVTMTAAGLFVREKGRRAEYGPVPYGWLLVRAAEGGNTTVSPRRRVTRNVLALGR